MAKNVEYDSAGYPHKVKDERGTEGKALVNQGCPHQNLTVVAYHEGFCNDCKKPVYITDDLPSEHRAPKPVETEKDAKWCCEGSDGGHQPSCRYHENNYKPQAARAEARTQSESQKFNENWLIHNLSMLVAKLCRRLQTRRESRSESADKEIAEKAYEFLCRHNIQGPILREAQSETVPPSERTVTKMANDFLRKLDREVFDGTLSVHKIQLGVTLIAELIEGRMARASTGTGETK